MVNLELQIRDAREKAGITQEELAEQMDVSRQTISRWETGATRPSADNLARLSQLLGIPADALLGVEPIPPAETPGETPAETPVPVSRRNRGLLVPLAALILAAGIVLGALLFGRWGPDAVPASNTGSEVATSSGEQPGDPPETEKKRPRVFQEWELEHDTIDPSTVIHIELLPPLPPLEYELPEREEEQFSPQALLGAERQ